MLRPAPVYEGSEFFMGVRESQDGSVVDPASVRWVSERLHVESEILKQQRLSQQERRAIGLPVAKAGAAAAGDEDGDGGATGADEGGRGGAKGRRGGRGKK